MNDIKLKSIDKFFLALIWIPFPILTTTLLFWWAGYLLGFKDQLVGIIFLGLALGIIICSLTFKKFIQKAYNQSNWLLVGLYLFYMIGIFGFFMGVPIFNIIPGILAGIYFRRKTIYLDIEKSKINELLKRVQAVSAFGMIIISICSAYIALNDPYTGANIKGMFNLLFVVTEGIIWGIIVIGGIVLMASQYLIIRLVSRKLLNN